MLFFLLFFMLYLAPVVPVARRIEYVRTRPIKTYINATRKVSDESHGYLYTSGKIMEYSKCCNNCGGTVDYHAHGNFSNIGRITNDTKRYGDQHYVCSKFVSRDTAVAKNYQWGGEWAYVPQSPKVLSSLGIAAALWFPLVIREAAKVAAAKIDYDPKNFAKPYHGVETMEQTIARMEVEAKQRDAEIERLETENKIPTLKEIS